MKKVLSLIQPTGDLHLGNYFGAIKNWVDLQDQYECVFGVADYHTMTMPYAPETMRTNTWKMVYQLLACGVKAENLFIQSLIPEHAELCWIMSCVTSYGELSRMTQFKDKSDLTKEKAKDAMVSAGLLLYPVLQVADILIYKADYVPIGKDQEQHLELSRNVAERFNHYYGADYFVHPEAIYTPVTKLLSLADPEKKMSKSLGEKHYISLFGDPTIVTKQVKTAVTDAGTQMGEVMSPGVKNLLDLLKACGKNEAYDDLFGQWQSATLQYGKLKSVVAEALVELTGKFRSNLEHVMQNERLVKEQIYESSARIRKQARQTLDEVRALTGLPNMNL